MTTMAPVTSEESTRLMADLKRLAADPEWDMDARGTRYIHFARRIDDAVDGIERDVTYCRQWLADLDKLDAEKQQQLIQENQAKEQATEDHVAQVRRGVSENTNLQAWLDTLEDCSTITHFRDYMYWIASRRAEFEKFQYHRMRKGEPLDTNVDYIRQWADEHLSERVTAQRAANSNFKILEKSK